MEYDILSVDGPYLSHRSFLSPYNLITSTGFNATMIHGFFRSLNALRKQFNPKQIIIAWESYGTPSWRKSLYSSYKQRSSNKISQGFIVHEYVNQLMDIQKLLYLFGVKQYSADENEADDVIATLTKMFDDNILIFTVDKDIMQLVDNRCHVYNGKKIFDEISVEKKFFVKPKQIPDFLAVVGDSSDNIKGIDGYGPKKASKIIAKYGDIESIPISEELGRHKHKLSLNKKLTTLNKDCKLKQILDNESDITDTIKSILDKYELSKMKEKIDEYKLLATK